MTIHSIDRTIERTGLNRKAAMRMIENAQIKGVGLMDLPARKRNYLKRKEEHGAKVRYYAGYCFLFNEDGICITMYKEPRRIERPIYEGKTLIRNPKKYCRLQPHSYLNENEVCWAF